MNAALVILSIICLALMAMNYALVNRLMRQSGHAGMSATSLLKEAEKLIIEGDKTPQRPSERLQRMGRKIGSTGPIDPLPDYAVNMGPEVRK
jgi:hypothetical protein